MNPDSWKDSNYYILCPRNGAFLQNLRNKTMTNKEVIERVKQGNWCAKFQPKQEANVNNDGNLMPKLTPQNAEQEHLVQILLAMKQGFYVEADYGAGWTKAIILLHGGNFKYRIKPELMPTPLPISRELWSYIDKRWLFVAMDENKEIYFYEEKPYTYMSNSWVSSSGGYSKCPLNINTDGINWETSLTERPEGV